MNAKNKTIALLIAVIMTSAIVVPLALANTPDDALSKTTEVTVIGDNPDTGSPPEIKAKWEKFSHYVDGSCVEMTYDDDPTTDGIQVFPPGLQDPQGKIDIEFWTVVTDPQGLQDIQFVSADVYHPDGSKKYQVMLLQACEEYWDAGVKAQAFAELEAADEAGAITYGEGYDLDDLKIQYAKGEAWIYMGVEWLDYHQPCGEYTVEVCAADQGLAKDYLKNFFDYVKEVAIALDFETLNFGDVKICKEAKISGDEDMTTPDEPTVKNLGNSPCKINVEFDDMDFGYRTENGDNMVWNVGYDARLGMNDPVPMPPSEDYIDPCEDTELPGELPLCNQLELDFSIHVSKAEPGPYTGNCTIWATDHMMP